MTTVILGEHPEVQTMIEQRRALGQDGSDEIWEGVYYVVPHAHVHHGLLQIELGSVLRGLAAPRGFTVSGEFNLGKQDDYRVPDLGVHRGRPGELYVPMAAMIGEILTTNDKTFEKFAFYGHHGVEEILVADLVDQSIRMWQYDGASSSYRETGSSVILATSQVELESQISWP